MRPAVESDLVGLFIAPQIGTEAKNPPESLRRREKNSRPAGQRRNERLNNSSHNRRIWRP